MKLTEITFCWLIVALASVKEGSANATHARRYQKSVASTSGAAASQQQQQQRAGIFNLKDRFYFEIAAVDVNIVPQRGER